MSKFKFYVFCFLVILFTTLFVSNHSFAKDTSSKGVPAQIEDLQSQINALVTTVTEQKMMLTEVKSQHDHEVTSLQDELQIQNEKITHLTRLVNDQQEKINLLELSSKSQSDNLNSLQSKVTIINDLLANFISVQFTTFKETTESQIHNILQEISKLKNNPPTENSNGYSISGKMIDSNGKPFCSGFALRDQNGKRFGSQAIENDGSFVINNVPNGSYTVSYYLANYQIESPQVVVVNGTNVSNLVIKLAVPTYTISGKALALDGTLLNNQQVWLSQNGSNGSYWPSTSSNGTFFLDGIAPGTYTILIGNYQDPLSSMVIEVSDQDITNLVVKGLHAYKVSGKLVDSEGKSFYTAFTLRDQTNNFYQVYGDENGFYSPNLPNGIYSVNFQLQPYHNLLTTPDEIVVNGSNIDGLEIKINAPTYSVSGIAKDKDGNLLTNERIHIFSPSTSGWGGRPTTNPDGTFTVKGLPNGTYLLKFGQNPSDPIAQGEVTINNGSVEGIVIQGI
jgi:TolA-binding protein